MSSSVIRADNLQVIKSIGARIDRARIQQLMSGSAPNPETLSGTHFLGFFNLDASYGSSASYNNWFTVATWKRPSYMSNMRLIATAGSLAYCMMRLKSTAGSVLTYDALLPDPGYRQYGPHIIETFTTEQEVDLQLARTTSFTFGQYAGARRLAYSVWMW